MGFYPFEKGDIKKSGYICTPFFVKGGTLLQFPQPHFFTH